MAKIWHNTIFHCVINGFMIQVMVATQQWHGGEEPTGTSWNNGLKIPVRDTGKMVRMALHSCNRRQSFTGLPD